MLNKHILTIQNTKKDYQKLYFDCMIKTLLLGDFIMLTAPVAKTLLEMKENAHAIIWDYKYYFEITIDSKPIAPQRMTTPPTARKFKTLAAAHSYLRNVLEYERGITILIAP